jgi:hypothetical protein
MKITPIPKITPFELTRGQVGLPIGEEVVRLPDHEHVVDHLREQRDSLEGELEAIRRLLDAAPQQSATAAAMKVKRQREFETERIMRAPVVERGEDDVRSNDLCQAHGAFSPEGDCFVCDAVQERERAEKAEAEWVENVLRAVMRQKAADFDLDTLKSFISLDRDRCEQALERLESEDRVRAVYAGRDRPHWSLVID